MTKRNQKEWAYAGFFFAMSGAVFSHLAVGDVLMELFGPTLINCPDSYILVLQTR